MALSALAAMPMARAASGADPLLNFWFAGEYPAASAFDLDSLLRQARFGAAADQVPGAIRHLGTAGATLRPARGWSASLYVSYFGARASIADDVARAHAGSFLNAGLAYDLSKSARVSIEGLNLLDHSLAPIDRFAASSLLPSPGALQDFAYRPLEERTLRLRIRTTF